MSWFVRDLQKRIGEWADKCIDPITPKGRRSSRKTFEKLTYEEVPELFANPTDPDEYADVAILLIDYAYLNGIDMEKAIVEKLAVLERDGMYLDSNGIAKRHKGDDDDKA